MHSYPRRRGVLRRSDPSRRLCRRAEAAGHLNGLGTPRLQNVAAPNFVLWKCSIPADDKLQATLATIHFDVPDARLHRLPASSLLSEHFAIGLPNKTIRILVEVPALDGCSTRISYSTMEA